MAKHLVIVESPAKGRTIEKYLGKDYQVLASYGHVRDLPKSKLGVDVEHGFAPQYVVPTKAKKAVTALKKAAESAETVYLATDYDREGEAIAWHVAEAMSLGKSTVKGQRSKVHRITFHEITKSAIQDAVAHPRELDLDLINAQQARRVLDRLVGYTLSPFLWRKVMKGLSAGRVQSVAVRLVVEREREIKAFTAEEYWTIEALLAAGGEEFTAGLAEYAGQKLDKLSIRTETKAREIETALAGAAYTVRSIETSEKQKRPSPPFTTSTLQQQASHRLHFSAKQTMKLAQDLYEAGHITYMRTDSMNLANEALTAIRSLVEKGFGKDYLPAEAIRYKTRSKGAQEAHEAIRPTDVTVTPERISTETEKHQKLYRLIWQRAVACQMVPARLKAQTVLIEAGSQAVFKATGNVVTFDGYMRVWPTAREDTILPTLAERQVVDFKSLTTEQHFTEPPARYSEATLVKALEERGIGRPSTYAPTLSTIQDRGYVQLLERRFHPTEVGETVITILTEHFPNIVDYDFTAQMEENLDHVAEGTTDWTKLLAEFWTPFEKTVEAKTESVKKVDMTEELDRKCPKSGHTLLIRHGRFGKFIACSGFPDCRYTEQIVQKTGVQCPECGQGELVAKRTRKGKTFWGCERYPDCKHATWKDPRKQAADESTEPKSGDTVPTE
ncbi:type I DNA topoisomerase [Candidatus Berkelbacteria bacterium]|nr:type I DNA topoisomerase [Candidatus Berkelbacteria bacterium]